MNGLVRQSQWIFLVALVVGLGGSLLVAWWASEAFPWTRYPDWEGSFAEPIQRALERIGEFLINCQFIFVFLIFWPGLTGLLYGIGLGVWIFPSHRLQPDRTAAVLKKVVEDRWGKISPILTREGPDAALQYHQNCQQEDENRCLSIFVPGEVCQWLLPLMGFLGTVWGLHQAIGPLKEGVHLMMQALGFPPTEASQLREKAMEWFGAGFEGLRVAFDTTFLSLLWLIVVGLRLEILRKRAFQLLSRAAQSIEEQIRHQPVTSLHQQILSILQQALFRPSQDAQQPPTAWLPVVYELLQQSLCEVQEGQRRPYLGLLSTLASLLQEGLFQQGAGSPSPLLQRLEAAMQEGLFTQQAGNRVPLLQLGLLESDEQKGAVAQLSHLQNRLEALRQEMLRYLKEIGEALQALPKPQLTRIEQLLEEILRDELRRTYLQWHHLRPEIHEILERLRARRGVPPPKPNLLTHLRMEWVNGDLFEGLDLEELEIRIIAVANRASKVSIGGYNHNAALQFVRDQSIYWMDRVLRSRPGVAWNQVVAGSDFDPSSAIRAMAYSPSGDTLFILSMDGTVTALKQDQAPTTYQIPDHIFPERGTQFLWLPGQASLPKVLCWKVENGAARMDFASLGYDEPLRFDPSLANWVAQVESPDEKNSVFSLRNCQQYLCIVSGLPQDQFGVKVARLENTCFCSLAEWTFSHPICSCDISVSPQGTPVVVLGVKGEGLYRWDLTNVPEPVLDASYAEAQAIYLNASGELLVTVLPKEVRVFSLSNPRQDWRVFPVEWGEVFLSQSSEDRSCLVLATDKKRVWLLLLEDIQKFIFPYEKEDKL